jgi:3D (Asp-Asp-Asp) domain-containing protein
VDRLGLSARVADTVHLNPGPSMDFTATWYTPLGGEGSGLRMRSGLPVSTKFIAADTRFIPLGSIVEIEYLDGRKEYRIVGDTGGAIKGNIIDVFVWSEAEADRNGRQQIKLKVLGTVDLEAMKHESG